jgi:FixJ family two-component response regulator
MTAEPTIIVVDDDPGIRSRCTACCGTTSGSHISEITVKVHRGQVLRKMNAASLPDLARIADKLNFTPEKAQTG